MDGKFTLEVPDNATIEISYIGYITQSISVSKKNNFFDYSERRHQALEEGGRSWLYLSEERTIGWICRDNQIYRIVGTDPDKQCRTVVGW